MSSGWLTMLSYVIRIRSLIWWLSHPDDLAGVGISSGWLTVNSLCHPDDIPFHLMSSGWLNWAWYLILMSYGSVIMSSGWDTLPVLSHPDEIANFDFPHHAVALQRFRRHQYARHWLCLRRRILGSFQHRWNDTIKHGCFRHRAMITSSNGNIFRVTGPLCGEFTGHRWIPLTKAIDA